VKEEIATGAEERRPTRSRWARGVLGLCVALSLVLGLEGLLRVFVPEESLLLTWEREDGLLFFENRSFHDPDAEVPVAEGDIDLGTRPFTEATLADGPYTWHVATNARGLREAEPTPRESPTDLRYLALGDSFVFGWSVDQPSTLSEQLELLLPDALGVASVEVINGGVFGSDALDMLRRFHFFAERLELDGVILGLPHNIRSQELRARRAHWYRSARGAPYVDSRLYLVLRRLLLPLSRPHYPQLRVGDATADGPESALRFTLEDLANLADDASERSLPVWMVLWNDNWARASQGTGSLRHWTDPLQRHGVKFAGHALDERACWGFEDVWHPSAAGHRAIAEVLAAAMASDASQPILQRRPRCQQ